MISVAVTSDAIADVTSTRTRGEETRTGGILCQERRSALLS